MVAAKLAVYTTAGALAGVVTTLAGLITAAAWWAGQGVPFSWPDWRRGRPPHARPEEDSGGWISE